MPSQHSEQDTSSELDDPHRKNSDSHLLDEIDVREISEKDSVTSDCDEQLQYDDSDDLLPSDMPVSLPSQFIDDEFVDENTYIHEISSSCSQQSIFSTLSDSTELLFETNDIYTGRFSSNLLESEWELQVPELVDRSYIDPFQKRSKRTRYHPWMSHLARVLKFTKLRQTWEEVGSQIGVTALTIQQHNDNTLKQTRFPDPSTLNDLERQTILELIDGMRIPSITNNLMVKDPTWIDPMLTDIYEEEFRRIRRSEKDDSEKED